MKLRTWHYEAVANKALQPTDNPLRNLSAAELGRYVAAADRLLVSILRSVSRTIPEYGGRIMGTIHCSLADRAPMTGRLAADGLPDDRYGR